MIALAVDIGVSSTKISFITDKGEELFHTSLAHDASLSPNEMVASIASLSQKAMEEHPEFAPVGLGVGCPGLVDSGRGVCIYSANLKWKDVDLLSLFKKELGLDTYIDNDANAAVLGEVHFGVGKCYKNIVLLTLGTGVGSGIYLDGKLYGGDMNMGAELGHTSLKAGGLQCSCGRKGCLEAYVSIPALKKRTFQAMENHPTSLMWKLASSLKEVKGETPFRASDMGDEAAKQVIEEYISDLGEGCLNIINTFHPEAIILSGGLSKEGEKLRQPLDDYLSSKREELGESIYPKTKVLISTFGPEMGVFGAASLVYEHHKSNDFSKKGTGYVANLIRKTGYMPLVIAYSVMIVLNDKDEVLLEERSDDHFFDFPGGSIEFNETAEEAAKRELFEETGLKANSIELFSVYSGPLTFYRYWDGHTVSGVDLVYLTRDVSGSRKPQEEEVKAFGYYSLDNVPEKMSPRNKKIISDLKDRLEKK